MQVPQGALQEEQQQHAPMIDGIIWVAWVNNQILYILYEYLFLRQTIIVVNLANKMNAILVSLGIKF